MKMYLGIYVYGDELHFYLSDVRGHEMPNEIFYHKIDLKNFNVIEFQSYIKNANNYVKMILEKHHNKRTYELANDLHYWYQAVKGYMETKVELGML